MENPFKKVELIERTHVRINAYKAVRSVGDGIELLEDDEVTAEFSESEIRTLHEILGHYLVTVDGVKEPRPDPDRPFQVGDRVFMVNQRGDEDAPPIGTTGTVIKMSSWRSIDVQWDHWDKGWEAPDEEEPNCWCVGYDMIRHYS